MQFFWNFVTDFGDTAVTLPLAAASIAFLFFSGWSRAALAFALALAACGTAIGLLKLGLESCGHPLLHTDITNPSGHAAVSTTVYGSLAVLFRNSLPAERRWLPVAGAFILVIGIAVSRVVLDDHSLPEVAIGLSVGLVAVAVFVRALAGIPSTTIRGLWLAIIVVAVIAAMHGSRWPLEEIVHRIAHWIRHTVPRCA